MGITDEQKKFLVREQVISGGIFNALLNAGIAWAIFPASGLMPLYGDPSVAGDTIATAFLLPFLIGLIVTPLVRKAAQQGKVASLSAGPEAYPVLRWLPRNTFARAALLGLVFAAVAALPVLGALNLLGVEGLTRSSFILLKAVFAGVLSAVVAPLVALYALATPRAAAASQAA